MYNTTEPDPITHSKSLTDHSMLYLDLFIRSLGQPIHSKRRPPYTTSIVYVYVLDPPQVTEDLTHFRLKGDTLESVVVWVRQQTGPLPMFTSTCVMHPRQIGTALSDQELIHIQQWCCFDQSRSVLQSWDQTRLCVWVCELWFALWLLNGVYSYFFSPEQRTGDL